VSVSNVLVFFLVLSNGSRRFKKMDLAWSCNSTLDAGCISHGISGGSTIAPVLLPSPATFFLLLSSQICRRGLHELHGVPGLPRWIRPCSGAPLAMAPTGN
jgi:hypothetical protein